MSAMNIRTLSSDRIHGGVVLLLPSPEISRNAPSKMPPSELPRPLGDQVWPIEMMIEVNERLFEVVGAKRSSRWALRNVSPGGAHSLSKIRRSLSEVGDGGMYI